MDTISRAIAEQFAGRRCYLDGAPAKIVGRQNGAATVATDDGQRAMEWSWHTVNRVMRCGGFFES